MADKRIIELNTVNALTEDDYVMIDNATNGTGKVKATLFGGGIDYSTTEQDTGVKWIDGKPIYQKTIHFETPISISSSGTGLSDSYFSGMNIAQVIRAEVVIPYSSGSGMGTSPINFWERPNNQGYKVYVMSSWDNVEWLNIWYTKTTDTV